MRKPSVHKVLHGQIFIQDVGTFGPRRDIRPETDFVVHIKKEIREAANQIYNNRADSGTTPLHVVFVLDRRINWANHQGPLRQAIKELSAKHIVNRNRDCIQWVIYSSNYSIRKKKLFVPQNTESKFAVTNIIDSTRSQELDSMVDTDSVLFNYDGRRVFGLPSGNKSDVFIRTGNVQAQRGNVEKISFWALKYLKDVDFIMCDTWSISSIAAGMSRFLKTYDPNRQLDVNWDHLDGYLPLDHSGRRRISSVLSDVHVKKLLFLNSVTASGGLVRVLLNDDTYSSHRDRLEVLSIFSVAGDGHNGNVLHSLSNLLERRALRAQVSDRDSAPIPLVPINPETYFPRQEDREERLFRIKELAEPGKNFFHNYSGNGIFSVARRVRRGVSSSFVHFSYFVDINKMLRHPLFRAKMEKRLAARPKIDLVVMKASDSNEGFTREFLKMHRERFSSVPRVILLEGFEQISIVEEVRSYLTNPSAHVAFLDPVVFSGESSAELSQAIRAANDRKIAPNSQITFFCGLLRVSSHAKRDEISRFPKSCDFEGFSERTKFSFVECVLLPMWAEEDCPWMREKNGHAAILPAVGEASAFNNHINERFLMLSGRELSGVRGQNVFLKVAKRSSLPFTSGSLWLDENEVGRRNREVRQSDGSFPVDPADLMCAVASIAHEWRCRNSKLGDVTIGRKGDNRGWVSEAVSCGINGFNDPMLRAAIWRSFKAEERVVDRSNSDTRDLLLDIFSGQGIGRRLGALAGEAALAFGWRLDGLLGEPSAVKNQYWLKLARAIR